jgi:hypothetical protein
MPMNDGGTRVTAGANDLHFNFLGLARRTDLV